MTKYTDLFPDDLVLLLSVWFKNPASQFNYYVPNDSRIKYAVVSALGSGGQAPAGGSGAITKSKITVTPGELLLIQVGAVSTGSTLGCSFVMRANGTVICYSDRGRGIGPGGLAINSTGDLKKDGHSWSEFGALQGAPPTDFAINLSQGFGGFGSAYSQSVLNQAADPGGGGQQYPTYDPSYTWTGNYVTDGAGSGEVVIEYYNGDPGQIYL